LNRPILTLNIRIYSIHIIGLNAAILPSTNSHCVCRMQNPQKFQELKSRSTGTCKLVLDEWRWRGLPQGEQHCLYGDLAIVPV